MALRPRRPKHSASRKAAVLAGYRSALEKGIADDLTSKGIPFEYEKHTINYVRPVRSGVCNDCGLKDVGKRSIYTPDFRIPGAIFVESKGRFTGADRAKLDAVRSQHPAIDLRLLFAYDNWITKLHKLRYSEWAKKHGFQWAVGKTIPAEWLVPRDGWFKAPAGATRARD